MPKARVGYPYCNGACWGNDDGSPQKCYYPEKVGGAHYCFVTTVLTGAACKPSEMASELPPPPSVPAADCAAKGQSYGEVNGVVVCVPAVGNNPDNPAKPGVDNPDPKNPGSGDGDGKGDGGDGKGDGGDGKGDGGDGKGDGGDGKGDGGDGGDKGGSGAGVCVDKDGEKVCTKPDGSKCTTDKNGKESCVSAPVEVKPGTCDPTKETCEDGDLKLPEIPAEESLEKTKIGVESITPSYFSESNSCPATIRVPFGEISFQPICDVAGWLKPLVLAFAWLAAGLIVVGGFKE